MLEDGHDRGSMGWSDGLAGGYGLTATSRKPMRFDGVKDRIMQWG